MDPVEQIGSQTPNDLLDNGRARAPGLGIRDRGLSIGLATVQRALQRQTGGQRQSLVPHGNPGPIRVDFVPRVLYVIKDMLMPWTTPQAGCSAELDAATA